jgi:hypothetical protein
VPVFSITSPQQHRKEEADEVNLTWRSYLEMMLLRESLQVFFEVKKVSWRILELPKITLCFTIS